MEEVKNEILTLTKELTENLSKSETEYLDILEKIKEKVKELNNEQIQKKYNGIEYFVMNEDITLEDNFNKALKYIEYFEKSVEKNYLKSNGEMLPTIDKFRKAIQEKNKEEIVYCSQEFIEYMKVIKDSNKVKAINDKLSHILLKLNEADFNNLSEEQTNSFIREIDELQDIINDKVEIKEDKKEIPEDLVSIRKEMDKILEKSLFEGIENEYEFAIAYQLDENEIDQFQSLRIELKELLKDPINNKARIDDIRVEMFIILGVDPYTYKDNKKLIDNLEEPNKSRFAELKAKHDKIMENKFKKNPKKTDGSDKKDDGTEKTKPTGLIPVTPTTPVPTPTPEPQKKKKGRLVKFAKSAKEFYKRHKKAILLITGIILAAVALHYLLPSVMYMNSVLWHNAILSGASPTSGLPVVLHDINELINLKASLGMTYSKLTGEWIMANGAILNATAVSAKLSAAIAKVALCTGGIGIGTTVAVKNAYRLAKEKIEKFKNREKKPKAKDDKEKENIFINVKDSFKKGFEKGKSKVTEEWNKRKGDKKDPEPPKNPTEPKTENKKFQRKDVSDRINRIVNYLIDKKVISEKEKEELEKADEKTFMTKFKEIFNKYNIKTTKTDNEEKVEFNRTDINFAVSEFIKYCYEIGIYTDEDIKKFNEMDYTELRENIYKDPRFIEFEKMRTEWSNTQEEPTPEVVEEEKGKGL